MEGPFSAHLLLDEELIQVVKSVTFLAIKNLGLESLSATTTTKVMVKMWKEGFSAAQLTPNRKEDIQFPHHPHSR